MLNSEEIEKLSFIPVEDVNTKEKIKTSLSEIVDYKLNKLGGNLFEQLTNDINLNIKEYNIENKNIKTTNINNIKNTIKQLGKITESIPEGLTEIVGNKFYLNNNNGIDIEKNESIKEYIKNNFIELILYGNEIRGVGDIINLDFVYSSQFLTDPRNEFSGNCLITKIVHLINTGSYIQKVHCIKTGLNEYAEREATMNN
jgi:hypothetical protein